MPEGVFIYIWLSNESEGTEVWFDDLSIRHTQTLVAQATDYGVWGEVLREQRADARKYRYGYQSLYAEKDEETGWNHFELRQYDPIVGRWLSVDPYRVGWSPYIGMGNNPVNAIDPDGGSPWRPDQNGNLVAEAGDNATTLAAFLNIDLASATQMLIDQGFTYNSSGILNLKVGDVLTLDNVYTRSITAANANPAEFLDDVAMGKLTRTDYFKRMETAQTKNYNCWGSTYSGTQGKPIVPGVGIGDGTDFDKLLTGSYKQVPSSSAVFGKTAIRFQAASLVKHGAVFYGRDRSGEVYVYTKNGWVAKPQIMKLSDLMSTIPSYGSPGGIGGGSGYYNPK